MISKNTLIAFILTSSILFAGQEKKISLDELPKNILTQAKETLKTAKFISANIEKEKDQTFVYEIQGRLEDGRKFEYDVKKDGTVEEIEIEFPLYMVPKAILKDINSKYKNFKATYIEASHSKDLKILKYEFEGFYENKKLDIEVSDDGKSIIEADK